MTSSILSCFILLFIFFCPHSSLPSSPHPPKGNPSNVPLFVCTGFCKRCIVCVHVFSASVRGTTASVSYFSHSAALKVCAICCLWLETAPYTPRLHAVIHRVFPHILLAMGIPPPHPTPAISTATTLPPQLPWASLLTHVSSWTQARILLGTFTQTWDFWIGRQAHTSSDELCQMVLHRSSHPCQHLASPTFASFAKLMGAK